MRVTILKKTIVFNTICLKSYCKVACIISFVAALLLLYDVTNKTSFDNIRAWLGEIREYAQDDVVIMLLGKHYIYYPISSSLYICSHVVQFICILNDHSA